MRWIACWVACWMLCSLAPAAGAEALRFDPPVGWTAADALPDGVLYAARSPDGRWALFVACEATDAPDPLAALAARYQREPGVTVGLREQWQGVDTLPLWEHHPQGDAPFTLLVLACAAEDALYRFALYDLHAAGVGGEAPMQTLRALGIRPT